MSTTAEPRRSPTPPTLPAPALVAAALSPAAAPQHRLSGADLLTLQLLAVGYVEDQISTLTDRHPETVRVLVTEAVAALDATDARTAIATARRRGLIL